MHADADSLEAEMQKCCALHPNRCGHRSTCKREHNQLSDELPLPAIERKTGRSDPTAWLQGTIGTPTIKIRTPKVMEII
jgi:hypothetical protein